MIEMIIVVALFAILSIVIVNLFIGQNRLYRTQTSELKLNSSARASLDDIDAATRSATRAVASYSTFTAGAQVLVLEIQSVNAQDQLIPSSNDYVVYYLNNANLYRETLPDALSARSPGTKKLAENVGDLAFTLDSPDYDLVTEVATDLTISEDLGLQTKSLTLSSKSRIRNK